MRVNKNVPQRERRRMALDNFKGVDFSSPPLACSPTRSPDAVNFIGDHGINRKRHGWEQVMDKFDGNINGIHQVNENEVLIHAGEKLYCATCTSDKWEIALCSTRLQDKKNFFIKSGGAVYFLASTFLMKYEISTKTVETISPYIPTTTINIGERGSTDTIKAVLDMPNLLTRKRKNTFVGKREYVDSKPTDPTPIYWEYDTQLDISKTPEIEITATIFTKKKLLEDDEEYDYDVDNFFRGVNVDDSESNNIKLYIHTFVNGVGIIDVNIGKMDNERLCLDVTSFVKHYVSYQEDEETKQKELLASIYEVRFDVTFTFSCLTNQINNIQEGMSFAFAHGIGGAQDRFFIGGATSYKNTVFFSEVDKPEYFPDQYTITCGFEDNSVNSFHVSSDGSATFFGSDGVAYAVKGEYRNIYDGDGNLKKNIPVFSIETQEINVQPVSSYACLNFNGDSLFLSKNGIYAIEPQQNVAADIRVARNRAAMLDEFITKASHANVSGIVYGNRCYFSFGDAGCLVADAAYRYMPEGELSYNYEWWYLDNVPARTWAIVNGELWFGSVRNRILRFTDGYIDSYWSVTGSGNVVFWTGDEDTGIIKDGSGETIGSKGDTLYYGGSELSWLTNGRRVQFMTTAASGDKVLTGVTLYMCNVDKEQKTFQLSYYNRGDDVLTTDDPDLVDPITCTFDDTYSSIRMRFFEDTPVKASWSTPPLDLDNDAVAKTMHSMTVTAESGTGSKFKFGYETRNGFMERNVEGTGKFDLNNIDFNDFTFENGFQNSFTVRTHARDFNYIKFHIVSDEASPCAVHRISAEYKYNKRNRGVK